MTLSTLENKNCNPARTRTIVYICITVFCAIFGLIYEYFSHGIWSYYMALGFLVPCAGIVIWLPQALIKKSLAHSRCFCFFTDAAIATLGLGSYVQGALEIYGTEVGYISIYLYAGIALAAMAFITLVYKIIKRDFQTYS